MIYQTISINEYFSENYSYLQKCEHLFPKKSKMFKKEFWIVPINFANVFAENILKKIIFLIHF